jgi:hypothetical protein
MSRTHALSNSGGSTGAEYGLHQAAVEVGYCTLAIRARDYNRAEHHAIAAQQALARAAQDSAQVAIARADCALLALGRPD